MTTITAKGETIFGPEEITITGEHDVAQIDCVDDDFKEFVRRSIGNAEGWMANAYYPEANTMLQAFATLRTLFRREKDITVDGELDEIEHEEGVIY